ncbi:unnamed protein product [Lampetra planeri]
MAAPGAGAPSAGSGAREQLLGLLLQLVPCRQRRSGTSSGSNGAGRGSRAGRAKGQQTEGQGDGEGYDAGMEVPEADREEGTAQARRAAPRERSAAHLHGGVAAPAVATHAVKGAARARGPLGGPAPTAARGTDRSAEVWKAPSG